MRPSRGQVAIWIYGRDNNGWLFRRSILREGCFSASLSLSLDVDLLDALPLAVSINIEQIEHFGVLQTFAFPHLRLIIFDQMLPRIANYWRRQKPRY
jgi:hypothetical protein